MITEVVIFNLPEALTREQVAIAFRKSVEIWRQNPDLLRKYYLYDPVKKLGGGVYLWKSLDDAKRWHGETYRQKIKDIFGSEPSFAYYETSIAIDNPSGTVSDEGVGA